MPGRTKWPLRHRSRVHRAHLRLWSALVGGVIAFGGLAFVQQYGWAVAVVGFLIGTVTVASCVLAVRGVDSPEYVVALRTGAFVTGLVMATMGLAGLVGSVAYLAWPLVAGTCPGLPALVTRAWRAVRGRRRAEGAGRAVGPSSEVVPTPGSIDMSAFEVELEADDEDDVSGSCSLSGVSTEELCRIWRRSFVLLAQDIPPESVLRLLRVREECLEELRIREPDGYQQLIESGETPISDLRPFFGGSGETAGT